MKMNEMNNPDIACIFNNIGKVYSNQGLHQEAINSYSKALEIWLPNFGPNHPDIAASYLNMGNIYAEQGKYSDALEYLNKSLDIWSKIFGTNHPDVGLSLNSMGRFIVIKECTKKHSIVIPRP